MCFVFDIASRRLLFQEPNASSVAFNTQHDDLFCFSGNGILSIKSSNHPTHHQSLEGFVVGFQGSRIFCLTSTKIITVDVPQSASLRRHLDEREYAAAYAIACLGVTSADWKKLGIASMEALQLDVAFNAFSRIKHTKFLYLISELRRLLVTASLEDMDIVRGLISAHQGFFHKV